MRHAEFNSKSLASMLRKRKIATMAELMAALGSGCRRTVFRKLRELEYRTSYSHRGRFYALDEVADFDERGLWTHRDVHFSVHGTLMSTGAALVDASDAGYFAEELDNLLHVSSKDALRKLVEQAELCRERLAGQFLYCAADASLRRDQLRLRQMMLARPGVAGGLPKEAVMPDELRAAVVLFFSMLDEKFRRLYAGLEALKTGRGGDAQIASLLGIDVGTVARGRRELLEQDVEVGRVRRQGAGRRSVEKKRRK